MNKFYTFIFLAFTAQLAAQTTWVNNYMDGTYSDYIGRIVQKSNGEYVAHFASKEASNSDEYQYLMLLSEEGEILELDTSVQAYGAYPQPWLFPLANGSTRIIGFWETPDSNAMTRAWLTPGFTHVWEGAVKVPKPGVPVMMSDTTFIIAGEFGCGIQVFKLGLSGYVHWQNEWTDPVFTNCTYDVYHNISITKSPDGGVFVATVLQKTGYWPKLWLAKFSGDGVLEWSWNYANSVNIKPFGTVLDNDFFLTDGNKLWRFDSQGNEIWSKSMTSALGANAVLTSLVTDETDGTLMAASYIYNSWQNDLRLTKMTAGGDHYWTRTFGYDNLKEETGLLLKTKDNGYLFSGRRFLTGNGTYPTDALLMKTDSVGGVGYSILKGKAFKDADGDCQYDTGEEGIKNKPVRVVFGPGEFYTMTDSLGDYKILLNEGTATVQLGSYDPYLNFCEESQTITVGNLDTITYDAGADFIECPMMNVDMGGSNMRPCSTAVYTIWYKNQGNLVAEDVTVKLYLDDLLTLVSASVPYTLPEPGVLEFSLGNVEAGVSYSFNVTVEVSCNAVLGDELCSTATIQPDTICVWNPYYDIDPPYLERACNIVANSFDPNDKLTLAGTPEFIGLDSILKYKIRFQNTGTDLAYNIHIRDTLSQWVEPLSIEPGASSHPYTWELRHPGEIRFIFNNIMLPDSNSNEPASHGYVQFKIRQKPALPRNTLIQNRAGIYFDFNPPVMTNQTAQAVDYPDHPGQDSLALCAGQAFNGQVFLSDTIVVDTFLYPTFDSILTTKIHVLPVFSSAKDTTVAIGSMLGETAVYAPQFVELHFTAINGCDSTVTVNTNVLPGVFAGNLISGKSSVCEKTAFNYAVPPNADAVFQWTVSGGVVLGGQGTDEASILWDDAATGSIAIAVFINGDTVALPPMEVEIFQNNLEVSAIVTDLQCFGDTDGSINLAVGGSGSPFQFDWSNGATTEDLANLPAGEYEVEVENSYGCHQNLAVSVTSPSLLSLQSQLQNISCFGAVDGFINLAVNGGTPGYEYLWSTGATSPGLSDLPAGSYAVTLTDANGCTQVSGYTLNEPSEIAVAVTVVQPGQGQQNGGIFLQVSGGVSPYTYQWNNGAIGNAPGGLSGGVYDVTVTDAHGCTWTESIELEEVALAADDLVEKYRLTVFPNPVDNELTVEFSLPHTSPVNLQVVNALGQIAAEFIENQSLAFGMYRFTLPAGEWAPGVYTLNFSTDEGRAAIRFVKI